MVGIDIAGCNKINQKHFSKMKLVVIQVSLYLRINFLLAVGTRNYMHLMFAIILRDSKLIG